TAAGAGSTVGLRASRPSRTYGSTPSKPRGRVRGFCARDGTRESASQDECTKTSRLDPETVRASTVLPPNQGRTESPLLRSGEVFQQTVRGLRSPQRGTKELGISSPLGCTPFNGNVSSNCGSQMEVFHFPVRRWSKTIPSDLPCRFKSTSANTGCRLSSGATTVISTVSSH